MPSRRPSSYDRHVTHYEVYMHYAFEKDQDNKTNEMMRFFDMIDAMTKKELREWCKSVDKRIMARPDGQEILEKLIRISEGRSDN